MIDKKEARHRTTIYLTEYHKDLLFENNMWGDLSNFVRKKIEEEFDKNHSLKDSQIKLKEKIVEIETKLSKLKREKKETQKILLNINEKIKEEKKGKIKGKKLKEFSKEEIEFLINVKEEKEKVGVTFNHLPAWKNFESKFRNMSLIEFIKVIDKL